MKSNGNARRRAASIGLEDRFQLEGLAQILDDHARGKSPIAAWQAAAYRDIVRRVLNPPLANLTISQRRQVRAAYAYMIRLELYGAGKWKKARGDTAEAHAMADTSVSKYATRWGKLARGRLEQVVAQRYIAQGSKVSNRRQRILRSELRDLEHDYPDD
jgi:hypothetical protein